MSVAHFNFRHDRFYECAWRSNSRFHRHSPGNLRLRQQVLSAAHSVIPEDFLADHPIYSSVAGSWARSGIMGVSIEQRKAPHRTRTEGALPACPPPGPACELAAPRDPAAGDRLSARSRRRSFSRPRRARDWGYLNPVASEVYVRGVHTPMRRYAVGELRFTPPGTEINRKPAEPTTIRAVALSSEAFHEALEAADPDLDDAFQAMQHSTFRSQMIDLLTERLLNAQSDPASALFVDAIGRARSETVRCRIACGAGTVRAGPPSAAISTRPVRPTRRLHPNSAPLVSPQPCWH